MILILSANAYPGNINATVGRASCKNNGDSLFSMEVQTEVQTLFADEHCCLG
jgi:hypothetical protein